MHHITAGAFIHNLLGRFRRVLIYEEVIMTQFRIVGKLKVQRMQSKHVSNKTDELLIEKNTVTPSADNSEEL